MTLPSTRTRSWKHAVPSRVAPGETLVRGSGAYLPDVVHAKAIRIVFLREETAACSKRVIFPGFGMRTMLPAGQTVVVEPPAGPPGTYDFRCAMGILRGCVVLG